MSKDSSIKQMYTFKNMAGIATGVGIGALIFKIRNPLLLMAFGVAGGVVTNKYIAQKDEGSKSVGQSDKPIPDDITNERLTILDPNGNPIETVVIED
jgi:hypothetical protein